LRIWNEEIEEKKKSSLTYLQKRTPSTEEKYKEKKEYSKESSNTSKPKVVGNVYKSDTTRHT
jgi:hypothetical protein